MCEACATEDAAKATAERDVHDAGPGAADHLFGRYWTAVIADPD